MSKERSIAMLKLLQENGYDLESLAELMEDIENLPIQHSEEMEAHGKIREEAAKKSLNVRVTKMLLDIGVPTNILGFGYLRTAIMVVYENSNMMRAITKELYPMIANQYGSTLDRVERAMIHAVESTFRNMSSETRENYHLGNNTSKKKKISNSEFISVIIENLRMEDAENL